MANAKTDAVRIGSHVTTEGRVTRPVTSRGQGSTARASRALQENTVKFVSNKIMTHLTYKKLYKKSLRQIHGSLHGQ